MHLHLDEAVSLAGFATAAFHVEAETARVVTARAGLGHFREQFAQRTKQAGVGSGVGARRAANGALVDVDDAIDFLEALDVIAGRHVHHGAVQRVVGVREQRVVHQGGLA